MAFHEKREQGVEFVEGVEGAEEVAGTAVGCEGEEVAKGRGDEGGKLLFREEF